MTDWFYVDAGKQCGPVTKEALLGMFGSGQVFAETMVWTQEFGRVWKPLAEAAPEAVGQSNFPPPLPPTIEVLSSNNDSMLPWIIAASPLLLIPICSLAADFGFGDPAKNFIIPFLFVTALVIADVRYIKSRNLNPQHKSLSAWFWLVPLYLYRRASVLGQPKWYLLAWFVAFFAAIGIQSPGLFTGEVYLGAGLPTCDARATRTMIDKVFDSIPLYHNLGIKIIRVDSITDVGDSNGKVRHCNATFTLNNTNTVAYTVTITSKDDQYYYELQLR